MDYPPTDSLYKFSAVSGLFIIAFSVYFRWHSLHELQTQAFGVDRQNNSLGAEAVYLRNQVDSLNEILDAARARQLGKYEPDPNRVELKYSEDEVKAIFSEIEVALRDLKIAVANADLSEIELKQIRSEARLIELVTLVSTAIGTFLSIWGFLLWYHRIQYYQDIALKDGSEKP